MSVTLRSVFARRGVLTIGWLIIVLVVGYGGSDWPQVPMAQAAYRLNSPGEAEYNAFGAADANTALYLPFTNSDPAWKWRTTAVVQNTGVTTATLTFHYLSSTGSELNSFTEVLAAQASRAYLTPAGISGSLYITATQAIAGLVMAAPLDSLWTGDSLVSYAGATPASAGTSITVSPIFRAAFGWEGSVLAVQNTSAVTTSITLGFVGTATFTQTDTLPPNSAHFYNAASLVGLGPTFSGHVNIQSAQPVVGAVINANSQTGDAGAHNHYAGGGLQAYLPHMLENSFVEVSNSGVSVANVLTVFYAEGGSTYACAPSNLGPGSRISLQPGASCGAPAGEYAAVVSADQPVNTLVASSQFASSPRTYLDYNGFGSGATTTYIPYVRKFGDDAVTQFSVQNVGVAAATVAVTYVNESGGSAGTDMASIPPGAAHRFDQSAALVLPTGFRGSAVVAADQPVAVIGLISQMPIAVSGVAIAGPAYGAVNASHVFTATLIPITATLPITYTWTPEPDNGNSTAHATYTWAQAGMQTITVTVANVSGSAQMTRTVLVTAPPPDLQWALSGLNTNYIDAVAVAASDTYTVYAASGNSQRIWKSINGGDTWGEVQFGQPHYALAVSPLNASVAYAGQAYGVLKTVNGGTSWVELQSIGASSHTGLAIDPQNVSTVYAAVSYGWGGYKTTTGGSAWTNVLPGLYATSVAIDPLNAGVVYMGAQDGYGTGGGVYKTINGGAAWTKVMTDTQVNALAIDPLSPNLIYAGTESGGVLKSADGGATWGAANAGLTSSVVRALAVDPTNPSVVYAGTWEGGVYRSVDNGANWSALNFGLTNTYILSLAIDPAHPGVVYAGTEGGGVFKSSSILQTPLTGVTISGPTVGALNVSHAFTATITPITATAPISYTWLPTPATGQGTANATYAWAMTGTQTITLTASNAGGSAQDTHAIAIVDPATGDAFEPDDVCAQASSLTTTGAVQEHTFHKQADADWASFTAISGTTYVLLAASTSAGADMNLELYAACGGGLTGSDGNAFGADASLTFVAPANGVYYAKAFNQNPVAFGPQVTYNLSARALSPVGAVLIVAGHDDTHSLQSNILYATNFAYRTFVNSGVPKTSIRYLSAVSSNALTDADGDGLNDVYATSSAANIQAAITTWATTMTVGSKALYIYLMDHGGVDVFLNNGSADTLAPDQLNGWLTTVENATGAKVSVIYEACHSGSFVDGLQTIAKPSRVVIASTSRENNAYPAALRGALFSDAFFTALGQNEDLYASFQAATAAVQATGLAQTPWLDDTGDAVPNAGDGALAQGRGLVRFAFAGTRPPVIDLVSPPAAIQAGIGQIQATVRDDAGWSGIRRVWVVVYPPSFVEPPPAPDGTTPDLNLPPVTLSDSNGDGIFIGLYENFLEAGIYRVVAYAEDTEGNLSAPVVLQMNVGGGKLYLPLIRR